MPVDDTVSGVWRDRLIFLVSGWSVDANVDAVQVYDPALNRWMRATPVPGIPVFGHAGGIVARLDHLLWRRQGTGSEVPPSTCPTPSAFGETSTPRIQPAWPGDGSSLIPVRPVTGPRREPCRRAASSV